MRDGIVGGVVVAALLGLGGYLIVGQPLQEQLNQSSAKIQQLETAKPRYAYITLSKSDSARCLGAIDVPSMGGHPGEPVRWSIVEDDDNRCRPDGPWAVWLVFEGSDSPFSQREMRIGRSGRTIPIRNDAPAKKIYKYKVWMRDHNGTTYELIDPDLEIEPPPP